MWTRAVGAGGGLPGGGGVLVLEGLAQVLERRGEMGAGEARGGLIRQRGGEAEGAAHASRVIALQRGRLKGVTQGAGVGTRVQGGSKQEGLAHHLQGRSQHIRLDSPQPGQSFAAPVRVWF